MPADWIDARARLEALAFNLQDALDNDFATYAPSSRDASDLRVALARIDALEERLGAALEALGPFAEVAADIASDVLDSTRVVILEIEDREEIVGQPRPRGRADEGGAG
jgi:hypothetical protein